MRLSCKVLAGDGMILGSALGEDEVYLVYQGEFQEGSQIVVEGEKNSFVVLQLDDVLGEELVFLKEGSLNFQIPFGEKRVCYSPRSFIGERHLITVRKARAEEINSYRNLARNRYDQHKDTGCFPHATANVETRGEAVFAARNAIDGWKANDYHGEWPYGSWGINRNPDAVICVNFGREILADKLVIYLRADFPHDSWWKEITIQFSDGTTITCQLEKTGKGQEICFEKKRIEWVQLEKLIKADDPSLFPALTQIEVYGVEG